MFNLQAEICQKKPENVLFTDGMDGMGWDEMGWDEMGWDGMVGPLFFFGPYLENYSIIFLNFFSSLKYVFLKFILEYSRKKIGMFFFSKNFAKIEGWFFFRLFEHKFANFSKTTRYFFLIVFGPLRRDFKTSSAKKSKKITIFKFFKKFRTIQFLTIFRHFSILKGIPYKNFKVISLIKTKIDFSR